MSRKLVVLVATVATAFLCAVSVAATATSTPTTPRTQESVVHVRQHHLKKKRKHVPGCQTRACDERIGRLWALKQKRRQIHQQVLRQKAMLRSVSSRLSGPTIASWFDDSGGTACGTHVSIGMANKSLPCGSVVHMCVANNNNGCAGPLVSVTVEDRGPFVAGRSFDLNPGAKAALGCGDICSVMADKGIDS